MRACRRRSSVTVDATFTSTQTPFDCVVEGGVAVHRVGEGTVRNRVADCCGSRTLRPKRSRSGRLKMIENASLKVLGPFLDDTRPRRP